MALRHRHLNCDTSDGVRFSFLCLAFPSLFAAAEKPQIPLTQPPLVHLASGSLSGMLKGNTNVFEGIPFAMPPIGSLRWREPQPVAAWSGVRDATKPSHPCMQRAVGIDSFIEPLAAAYGVTFATQPVDPSEDCLYLNVWSPQVGSASHLLPVMVWLHGGSNRVGSGTDESYDGTGLASLGVIVVTINYRLGAMGFFSHPELTAESPHHSSGNYGLLDQMAGLRWVQQNIAQFGGDSANVTLFGESAGSVDATTLMTSPLSKGLFRRVIAESGPAFGLGPQRNLAQMAALGMAVGKEAGGSSGSQLSVLRNLPAGEIAQIEDRLIASQFKGYDPNGSIVDGWVLPLAPSRAFASGAIQQVDLLAGLNGRELSAFRIAAAAAAKKSDQPADGGGLSASVKQLADTAHPLYGDWTNIAVTTYLGRILVHGTPAIDQASNDILVACPIGAEAALTTSAGRRAFVYRFDRSVPGKGESTLGSFHGLEIPYVFNTFQTRLWKWLPFTSTDQKLSRIMETYWTNFAKSGDPNGAGLPSWMAWRADEESYMEFSQTGDAVPQRHFAPIFCHLAPDRLKRQLANN
jgi:para-nitrobenzyl esterase